MTGRARTALDPDVGVAAGGEMLAFGMLVFMVGSLMIMSAWHVVDAKFAVATAARHATRIYVESSGSEDEARSRSAAGALEALRSHGLDPGRVQHLTIAGPLERCARVQTSLSYRVPALVLPWVRGIGAVDVQARHSEIVDPLRSGVGGEAHCIG